MSPGNNPFIYDRVLAAGELVDRVDELAVLERNLRREGRLFLIGPRRFGKTSLLPAAAERATAAGTPTPLVNAERYTTLDALAGAVVAAAGELLSPSRRERAAASAPPRRRRGEYGPYGPRPFPEGRPPPRALRALAGAAALRLRRSFLPAVAKGLRRGLTGTRHAGVVRRVCTVHSAVMDRMGPADLVARVLPPLKPRRAL